jgi:hypothetical protein
MAITDDNTVSLYSFPFASPYLEHAVATAPIEPGFLCWISPVVPDALAPHAISGGAAEKIFACENGYEGKEMEDTYEVGERCFFRVYRSGDLVLAKYGDIGIPLNRGARVVSFGSTTPGTLRKFNSSADQPGSIVGVSLESITAPAAVTWLKIRIF